MTPASSTGRESVVLSPVFASGDEGLRALGWQAVSDPIPHLSVEALAAVEWAMGRLWTAGAVLQALAQREGTRRVIMSVDGEGHLVSSGRAVTLSGHQLVVFDATHPLRMESTSPWARYEWLLPASVLSLSRYAPLEGRAIDVHDLHWQLIAAITNTVIAAAEVEIPAMDGMMHTLSHAVATALFDARSLESRRESVPPLLAEAQVLIRQNFADRDYGVAALQADLLVSKTHLHRIFAHAGTTPRRELESARLDAALRMTKVTESTSSALGEVAAASGFRSPEQLRRALARRRIDAC